MIGDESVWVVFIVGNRQEGSRKLPLNYAFSCGCLRAVYLKENWGGKNQRITEVPVEFLIEYENGIALLVNGPRMGDWMERLDRAMVILT